jgi:hypothetical protein
MGMARPASPNLSGETVNAVLAPAADLADGDELVVNFDFEGLIPPPEYCGVVVEKSVDENGAITLVLTVPADLPVMRRLRDTEAESPFGAIPTVFLPGDGPRG